MPAPSEDLLAAALEYAAAGLPVFPLKPRGKAPLTARGFHEASADVQKVAAWWDRWPDANIGIPTGAASGYDALDVDVPVGLRSLDELERKHGKLVTAQVLTGTGGGHYWFLHSDELRNSVGRLGEGLDVRAEGGYVVAPPSVHESGNVYKWTRSLEQAADCPAWLLEDAEKRRNGPAAPVGDTIPKGQRNSTLASLAGTMRRRGSSEGAILAALRIDNERCQPPLPDRDVERIARSIARYAPDPIAAAETQADAEIAAGFSQARAKEAAPEPAEPFQLHVVTARDLCALPDPPQEDELLGPLVVRGQRLILGGHTGEGKTTIALQLLRAIVLGEPFLDWQAAGNSRALVIDAEQGLKTVKRRLREAGLDDNEHVDYVRVPDGLDLDSDQQHVAEVERVLADGGYDLVVADPLYKLHTGDSNAEREAVDLMRRFDAWREQHRFALLLPVHCRKPLPGTKFSIHDLFGSSAYVRGAEVVLGLQRIRDGYSRLHFLKDRDGDLPIGAAWGLLFDRNEDGFRRDPDDGKNEPTTIEQVAELLEQTPWMTKEALVATTGRSVRTIERALRDLGAVHRRTGGTGHGENLYALPDNPDDQADSPRLDTDSSPTRHQLALVDDPPEPHETS